MRRTLAAAILAIVLWCPLAASGVFTPCHGGEGAMDCCQKHEGSAGSVPHAAKVALATPALTPIGSMTPLAEAPARAALSSDVPWPAGELYTRLSTLLI